MQKNILKGYANTVCQMFAGWRLLVSPGDLPLLMDAGRGQFEVDLLGGSTTLDGVPTHLGMADEVSAWLREQAEKDQVPWNLVRAAKLHVAFDFTETEQEPGMRIRRLIFVCTCEINTDCETYRGSHRKDEVGTKTGDGPWIVY